MVLNITYIKSDRGPAVKVLFTVKCNGYGNFNEEIGPLNISNAASAIFKFSCVNPDPSSSSRQSYNYRGQQISTQPLKTKYTVGISLKKQHKILDKETYVKVSCKQLNFSKELLAYDQWLKDMQVIGSIECKKDEYFFDVTMISSTRQTFTFANLYDDTELTDFLLSSADGSTVAVHKVCLAAHSDVFQKMLVNKFKETTEGCVEFKDVAIQTLEDLKRFMYLGMLPENYKGVEPLLLIAKCYMMTSLLEAAVNKLCQSATAENLYSLLELATQNNIPELALGLLQMASDDAVDKIVKPPIDD